MGWACTKPGVSKSGMSLSSREVGKSDVVKRLRLEREE